ncbi:deaminase [Pseudonocardia sp. Cha107L01]|uniref:deaminase n=1 Tax=Pseudonocardia sp. Cha107L01 TaxID=3457576 RepID=UPI00403E5DDA
MCVELATDQRWLTRAIELSKRCPPVDRAYSVGAVIVSADGEELAYGYSRETDPVVHAEESALTKLAGSGIDLRGVTLYSTLEPCSLRASRPRTCSQLILEAGVGRVVLAWREPSLFVADAQGVELLTAAGVTVLELPELAEAARAVNAQLFQ